MKYAIVTLAVGDKYFNPVFEHYKEVSKRLTGDFYITTEKEQPDIGNVTINTLYLDRYHGNESYQPFYFNLKSLAFKPILDRDYNFVIYLDSDWTITDNLSDDILKSAFEFMEKSNIDMFFERPAEIGGARTNPESSFFKNKLDSYHALEHTRWDKAHVMNEQFFMIKNSWKLRYFQNRWEQFLWYSIYNNIWNYAEGFEAGISALESEMELDYISVRGLFPNCFCFKDRLNKPYTRF